MDERDKEFGGGVTGGREGGREGGTGKEGQSDCVMEKRWKGGEGGWADERI